MCFKKHVEKVHGIEQSYKRVKAQVAIRVILEKWTKTHICWICYKSFSHKCVLKKHVEKVHEIGSTTRKYKSPSFNESCTQKSENHHTMITSWNSKTSKCLICYQSFHKNVNLGNMLTQVMKIRSHRKVGFVIKVFLTKESLKACWKSSWDWTIIQKSKSPSCNKSCSQKSESKHTFVGFVIKVFLINVF